ncbi:MaoC/PaaZ C-terminal domain-containing protein [Serinibacter salmoneus]|uniref:MaoC dehydratase-like protein n=1 Tax=Serinibacter salmoneus TaxID=556530 RepID=A0A2A9CXN8_9MICO|nr:MaoC/PaaZ C-terminal domain-containing protein [Serinibacter salmoneus]PFG18906.1 MaoC dehydratase-like protein [Serinibacter salmoneus]
MTGILDHLEQGAEVFTRTVALSRDRLVRYAAASGDFNPIHYNDTVATSVGLPGVIAHGMLTMGLAGSVLTDWLESLAPGGAARVRRYGTRFSRPIPVPATGEVELTVTGTVGALDADVDGVPCVRIDLRAQAAGVTVLAKAQVFVSRA